ncbi:Ubiquitin carboxyl-terminal hydrolase [Thalictrum thalictroides]|uniref:Ubiquitin carboxyl-terminal hydrolase n=1 Tax=Thalictrum thalictroides TaxID=46969 RepID=A0A7J6V643_THATH|nr:Ubiquitin carboxyl-terminal hydrolase [Thalictrum thalictroides]
MLVTGDLGFTGLVLVFLLFFFFGPIISFLIQKKWRIAVEKKEEIMRLVAMASEEAARVEFEATTTTNNNSSDVVTHYVSSSSSRPFKCAVCYCPTTTRCSRCKLVRYCSGKCQIIHWRRGHKDECHPPSINSTHFNGPNDCDQNVILQGEQCNFYEKDLELDSRWSTKSSKRLSKRSALSKVGLSPESASGRGDDISCATFSTSMTNNESDSSWVRFSTSTSSNESPVDVSVGEVQRCRSHSRSKELPFDDVIPDMVEDNTNVHDTMSLPREFTGTSVNNISFSNKLKPKISSYRPGVINYELAKNSGSRINGFDECRVPENSTHPSGFLKSNLSTSSCGHDVGDDATKFSETVDGNSHNPGSFSQFPSNFKPQIPEFDDAYPKCFGNKRPTDIVTPENIVRNDCTTEILPGKPSRSSNYVDNVQSNGSQLPESKGRRSLSSMASDRHPSSGTRRSSTSSDKSMKVDSFHTMSTGLSEIASSSPNTSSGLRTSVRKVVQQFKVPKPSKTNPFGLSEVAERNNYKMLFPFDLFIKLYNWGKIELRPSGLMNCGNSCYANAVLQCLAFTQPLTAYLLQGLHSRACPRKEWCFTCEFEFLVQKASEGNSPLSPIGILSQLQSIGSHLGHGKEEDAHEFLRQAGS